MSIVSSNNVTYLLLNGIETPISFELGEGITFAPADTSHLDLTTALSTVTTPDDIPVVTAFIPLIRSQFIITGDTAKETAGLAWNAQWDALLLSAIFLTEVGFNLQSNVSAERINEDSTLRATNYQMYGFTNQPPYSLSDEDVEWLKKSFLKARNLLSSEQFMTAVHSLATFRWHSHPRIRIAVLWAGIESLFNISAELRFRLSQYAARFLYPESSDKMKDCYRETLKLYDLRSKAVHGSKMKGDVQKIVEDSFTLLRMLIRSCIDQERIPDPKLLAP
ncbi:MAG: hypothetical protein H8E26_09145 [FCB group bacterium]|nr:hypothetical protein [FCB group bacterium]MBL7028966.1 hypothetical protein [Candidatus Neomarinimicrobiota bacterium]MBL7121986.1 hypothetical protein [Candidatus Neomarinimicrobiota bacterium]